MSFISLSQIREHPIRFLLKVLCVSLVCYQLWLFAHVVWYRTHAPSRTAFMAARLELLQEKRPDARLQYRWVDYANISPQIKRAVVAAEDSRFTEHHGFDWDGMQAALDKNIKKGKVVAGGSTISQQLAKNLFLSSSRNPLRKIEEAIITVMLETCMSKRRILELYLNVIEWGEQEFGVEAAARYYYRTSAKALSASQSARLAAMIPNPRFYQRKPAAKSLGRKTATYLGRMDEVRIPR